MIWYIAWKNIWRNKVRSMVIIIAVFLGVFGGIFSSAVMFGSAEQRVRDLIDLETAHFRISNPHFDDNNEPSFFIPNADSLCSVISANDFTEAVSARLNVQAMASTASATSGVTVLAVDPENERKTFRMQSVICDTCGDFFLSDRRNPVIVGDKLAEKLNLRLKSKLIITFQDLDGNLTSASYKVSGIFHTTNMMVNEFNIFILRNDFQSLMMFPEHAANEIYVRVKDDADSKNDGSIIKEEAAGMKVQHWREADPTVGYMDRLMSLFMYLFMSIILLAIGFGVLNTMLMIVLERTRELGMLASIGMSRRQLFWMITLETTLLSLIGGLAGMVVSAGVIQWTRIDGLDVSSVAQGLESVGYSALIFPSVPLSYFFGVGALIVGMGMLSALYPARRATRLNPADAVRFE